jgi:hypothetical protein
LWFNLRFFVLYLVNIISLFLLIIYFLQLIPKTGGYYMKRLYFSKKSSKSLLLNLSLIIFLLFSSSNLLLAQSWNALGTGTSGPVYAEIVFNNELVVAGNFTSAGGVTVNNIARWNGTSWAALGGGTNGTIYALTIFNNQLIAGGSFTTAGGNACNRIAVWNGSSWQPLSIGMNDDVYALAVHQSQLIAGGAFTTAGGVTVTRIAKWNGSVWSYVLYYGLNDNVYALLPYNADLIAAGKFTMSGTYYTVKRVARLYYYSGGYYYPYAMGSGIDSGTAYSLTTFGSNLIVGGNYTHIGGIQVNYIASWNGSNWGVLGTGTNGAVKSLTNFNNQLYAGGTFTNAGGVSVSNIAQYSGLNWSALGTGINGSVNTLTSWMNILYAGGAFTTAGGLSTNNIAGWGQLPSAPTLISPPDGATNVTVSPTLIWSSVSSAVTYGVQVATDANFGTVVRTATNLTSTSWTVSPALNYNTTYFWRANARNGLGSGPWSLIRWFRTALVGIINTGEIPTEFRLYQNYPNPFNPGTVIRFDLPALKDNNSYCKLAVYDVLGNEVYVLYEQPYIAGKYEVSFDAVKAGLSSGIYFLKLTAGENTAVNKLILMK